MARYWIEPVTRPTKYEDQNHETLYAYACFAIFDAATGFYLDSVGERSRFRHMLSVPWTDRTVAEAKAKTLNQAFERERMRLERSDNP